MKSALALGGASAAVSAEAFAAANPGFSLFGIPITTMADLSAALAALFTCCLLSEWVWRKILRPFAEDRKWLKRKYRRAADQYIHDKYEP